MAFRLTDLKPYQGFAETGGRVILMVWHGWESQLAPLHFWSNNGVGATKEAFSAVRWGIGRDYLADNNHPC